MVAVKTNNPPMLDLWHEEKMLFARGARFIAGVDEVGRGPLAGPVIACAVMAEGPLAIPGVKDSKQCSEKSREYLSEIIRNHPQLHYGIGRVEAVEIDALNILRASLLAFKRALENCPVKTDFLLVDGPHINPDIKVPQKPLIKGDRRSFLIAAASIVAKVARDSIMMEMHARWPFYGFDRHKGYPTKSHLLALDQHGVCPIHRKSYAPVRTRLNGMDATLHA